ncbi:hypothetical protein CPB85DRAFT_1428543 [Mucidula mucida]|nr:hypothetical protein CPB85DRAFT_1428543 [Mucidula mucida]
MDDGLLQPTAAPKPQEDDANESDGEEDRPDWTKLSKLRPVIPKRGEKSHEPTGEQGTETSLQAHILQRARNAMFEALQWDPTDRRAKVTVARGVHFAGLGWKNWLLPEEALYLVERGAMVCTKHGGPMSVQQAYADMIGGDIPLEAYQVYAYLKRLGYVVTRYRPPFPDYPTAAPYPLLALPPGPSLLDRITWLFNHSSRHSCHLTRRFFGQYG